VPIGLARSLSAGQGGFVGEAEPIRYTHQRSSVLELWVSARRRKPARFSAAGKSTTRPDAVDDGRARRAEKRPQRSARRLWFFRLTALIFIPAALLLVLELSLRIFGFGYPTGFLLKTQIDEREVYAQNRQFGWRFFPKDIARTPVPFAVPLARLPDTYRVVILGASAALGVPDHTYSFGRILEVQLRDRFPGVNFEIVNAAAVAINSHVVLQIARDCARLQPDLFVVYLGNNEVVGPYGAGTIFAPISPSLSMIRAGLCLKSTRIGQLLARLPAAFSDASAPRSWTGPRMFLEKQVPADSADLEIVYRHFTQNLEDVCRVADEHQVPVILCTVATNLKDCPPFASLHRSDLGESQRRQWETVYAEGVALESRADYGAATERYRLAAEVDDHYADLHYRLGHCCWAMGEYETARQCMIRARDLDALRMRADTRINDIIRSVARRGDIAVATLLDAEKVVGEHSPYATPGEELFHEHVHLNFKGNFLLASAIRQRLEGLLPDWVTRKARADRPPLTEADCAARLAFTDWDRHRVVRKMLNNYIKAPPFTNQLYQDERLSRFERRLNDLQPAFGPEAAKIIHARYAEAIRNNDSDVWLRLNYAAFLLSGRRELDAAEAHVRVFLRFFPDYPDALDKLATILIRRGEYDEAVTLARKVLELSPNKVAALSRLANALRAQGKLDEAVDCYRQALRIEPNFTRGRYGLADTLLTQGNADEASSHYQQILQTDPNSAEAHYKLARALDANGQVGEALRHMREAVRLRPGWPPPAASLAWILATAPAASVRNGPEAVRLAEGVCQATAYKDPQLLDVLAAAYAEVGRFPEALEVARKALALSASAGSESIAERRRRLELYQAGRPCRVRPRARP
jgi:tetratricopeptide (TPR) repeat protein